MTAAAAPSAHNEQTFLEQRPFARAALDDVTSLRLWTEGIVDLSPLRRTPKLRKLTLYQTAVADLAPLAFTPALEELLLFENRGVADLGPIAGLSMLRMLDVDVPRTVRFAPGSVRALAALSTLRTLAIWKAPYARLDWLGKLERLEELLVHGCRVDAASLVPLQGLRELSLTKTRTVNVEPLRHLGRLAHLGLVANGITDLRPLRRLTNLTWLTVSRNALEELSPIAGFERLLRLDADHNRISSVPKLPHLRRLHTIDLQDNRLTDVSWAHDLPGLFRLNVERNRIVDLSPLRRLPRLESLHLERNRIRDLRPLLRLRSLVVVTAAGNRADSTPLLALPKIVRVDRWFKE